MNKLNEWRKAKGLSYQKLADKVGAGYAATARSWCLPLDHKDFRMPSDETRLHLQEATGGAVVASWWLSAGEGAEKEKSA